MAHQLTIHDDHQKLMKLPQTSDNHQNNAKQKNNAGNQHGIRKFHLLIDGKRGGGKRGPVNSNEMKSNDMNLNNNDKKWETDEFDREFYRDLFGIHIYREKWNGVWCYYFIDDVENSDNNRKDFCFKTECDVEGNTI